MCYWLKKQIDPFSHSRLKLMFKYYTCIWPVSIILPCLQRNKLLRYLENAAVTNKNSPLFTSSVINICCDLPTTISRGEGKMVLSAIE